MTRAAFDPLARPFSYAGSLARKAASRSTNGLKLGRSSIRYRIGIFAGDATEAAAEGEFVHVVVDRTTRRPAPIPIEWRMKLEAIS